MTGWRLGYAVWPKALFAHAERLAINCHSCVNAAAQYAGIAALTEPRGQLHRMVEAFAGRREMIVAALNGLPGFVVSSPAAPSILSPISPGQVTTRVHCKATCSTRPEWQRSPAPALANMARAICGSLTPTAERLSARRSTEFGNISAICRALNEATNDSAIPAAEIGKFEPARGESGSPCRLRALA